MPRKPGEKWKQKIKGQGTKDQTIKKYRDKSYDTFRRDKARQKLYNSARWKSCRNAYLKRHPLCEMCERDGLVTPATEVHHIKPIEEGGAELDHANLMSLCHSCHMQIHYGEGHQLDLNIVYGAPCSGKSTWVKSQAKPGDLVWDFDEVRSTLFGFDLHEKTYPANAIVMAMREAMYQELAKAKNRINKAWIIVTNPAELRERFPRATFWVMDTSRKACLERVHQERNGDDEVMIAVKRWFLECEIRESDQKARGGGGH